MKLTKHIKPNKFTELLRLLQGKFGFPKYYEELVIYLSGNNVNIALVHMILSTQGIEKENERQIYWLSYDSIRHHPARSSIHHSFSLFGRQSQRASQAKVEDI